MEAIYQIEITIDSILSTKLVNFSCYHTVKISPKVLEPLSLQKMYISIGNGRLSGSTHPRSITSVALYSPRVLIMAAIFLKVMTSHKKLY